MEHNFLQLISKSIGIYVCTVVLSITSMVACNANDKLDVITLNTPSGNTLTLELAITAEQRQNGLMFRTELKEHEGMLFVFPDSAERNFWMKNTSIPLSIAFIDRKGIVVHISDMQPFSLDSVPSVYPARYALEVKQGNFKSLGIKVGTRLDIPKTIKAKN